MGSEPRMPSPFQKFHGGISGKFEVTGDFPSVSDEQRRQLLVELLQKMFDQAGWKDIVVGKVGYSQIPEVGVSQAIARTSVCRIPMTVPVFVNPTGKAVELINVPPSGDWSVEIIRRVLLYMQKWASNLPARP
jgi:hypothetical protein